MEIRSIVADELSAYDQLAKLCGTVFNTCAWTDLFDERITRCGIFDKGGQLIGGFSIYRDRKLGLTILRNPPFTPMCGPFLKITAENPTSAFDTWRRVLKAMADFLDKEDFVILFIALDQRIQDTLPFYWRKFKVVPAYTYILDLAQPIEKIRSNMVSARRRNLNRCVRDGLIVKKTTDFHLVRSLVEKTFERQRKSLNRHYLNEILFKFANEENSYAFAVFRAHDPIACSFIIHDHKTAYYLLGGYNDDQKHHGAGALAMFEAIHHAKKLNLMHFDFEGSVIPRIERYFRGFGGQLKPYYTINKAWLPLELAMKFVRREIF